jgi:S1-C subfamily serine protease
LKTGDSIVRFDGRPVASFADASYALHKAPAKGTISLAWSRGGKDHSATLALAQGWKKTNVTWRPSMLDILPSVPFNGEELTVVEKKALGLSEKRAAIRQDDEVHKTLKAAGIRGGDIVVGFDGKSIDGTTRDLLGFVRRNYLVGDAITVNVVRGGKPVEVKLVLK